MAEQRVLFDVSTLTRWSGPVAGIPRVEREFAVWCLEHIAGAIPVFFDPDLQRYRPLVPKFRLPVILGEVAVDHRALSTPTRSRVRFIERVPKQLRPAMMWVLQFRRELLLMLERMRLATGNDTLAGLIDRIQRHLMTERYRALMIGRDGERRPFLTVKSLLGPPVEVTSDDILVTTGITWTHANIAEIVRQRAEHGFRLVVLVHDIIPVLFPSFYKRADCEIFESFLRQALPAADVLVCTTDCVRRDVEAFCRDRNLGIGTTAVVPLGSDVMRAARPTEALAAHGLEPDRYVLFVSTIEPRKGHRMILETWRRLIADGVPQRTGMMLVLVGRPGWMVDDLLAELRALSPATDQVVHLQDVDDAMLATLYRHAAFCVFPSLYEGYGLPVVEALRSARPVLASDRGPIPELVGGLSPCLDPTDPTAWYEMMRAWMDKPDSRAAISRNIAANYRPVSWQEAACRFFSEIEAGLGCLLRRS